MGGAAVRRTHTHTYTHDSPSGVLALWQDARIYENRHRVPGVTTLDADNVAEVVEAFLMSLPADGGVKPLHYLTACFDRSLQELSSRRCRGDATCEEAVQQASAAIVTFTVTVLLHPEVFPAAGSSGAQALLDLFGASSQGVTVPQSLLKAVGKAFDVDGTDEQQFMDAFIGLCMQQVRWRYVLA